MLLQTNPRYLAVTRLIARIAFELQYVGIRQHQPYTNELQWHPLPPSQIHQTSSDVYKPQPSCPITRLLPSSAFSSPSALATDLPPEPQDRFVSLSMEAADGFSCTLTGSSRRLCPVAKCIMHGLLTLYILGMIISLVEGTIHIVDRLKAGCL
jgi:hypothetical protein